MSARLISLSGRFRRRGMGTLLIVQCARCHVPGQFGREIERLLLALGLALSLDRIDTLIYLDEQLLCFEARGSRCPRTANGSDSRAPGPSAFHAILEHKGL